MVKRAIIITIILNSIVLIAVPAGHGYGLMVMFEFISIPYLIRNGIEFGTDNPFEGELVLIGLVSLIGKAILMVSLFYRKIFDKKIQIYGGLLLMLVLFVGISFGAWEDDYILFIITLGSGIPFLMYLGRVIYLFHKQDKIVENHSDEGKTCVQQSL